MTKGKVNGQKGKAALLLIILSLLFLYSADAQDIIDYEKPSSVSWRLAEATYLPNSNIEMRIVLYGAKKKDIYYHAKCAAIKILLFDGIGTGGYAKPLLSDGEHTVFQSYPSYIQNLYRKRYNDFIMNCTMESEFKKADAEKGTSFNVVVKASLLRRDLEKNGLKNKIGI